MMMMMMIIHDCIIKWYMYVARCVSVLWQVGCYYALAIFDTPMFELHELSSVSF